VEKHDRSSFPQRVAFFVVILSAKREESASVAAFAVALPLGLERTSIPVKATTNFVEVRSETRSD
jgi:hypothetical protein